MNYKIILLLFLTTFILTPAFALDCQYTQSVFDHAETIAVPYSVDSDDPIEEITYTIAGTEKAPIYFFNENDFNVDIEFDLLYYIPGGYTGNYGPHTSHITRTIIPGTSEMAFGYSKGYYSKISNLIYRQNEFVYLKNKEKSIYVEICKVCGDANCLDDGLTCSINSECGSNNCIRGVCSGEGCYNNDCNCAIDEIQFENRTCIKKKSVAIGGIPLTSNPEECITNYIGPNTGKCVTPLGSKCIQDFDCGENYCITGTCSNNSVTCYNNNCNCKETEIQFENRTCIPKISVINGNKPKTSNFEECISNYIDPNTGLCAMTPEQKELQEQNKIKSFRNFILAIVACFVIFIVVFVGYNIYKDKKIDKNKKGIEDLVKSGDDLDKISEGIVKKIEDTKKLIQRCKSQENELNKKLEKVNNKINHINKLKYVSADLKKELSNLQDEKRAIENEKQEINTEKMQLQKEKDEYEKLIKEGEKTENIVRFDPIVGREVIKIRHLGGYECFYDAKKDIKEYTKANLVHISVWRQKHGRNPKFGYVIHHKDFHKYNNDPENLVEISIEQHDKLHHKDRYKY